MSMKKPLILIGAGGHAKVVLDTALCAGFSVLGMADTDIKRHGESVLNIPIIDGDTWMSSYTPDEVQLVMGIGSVGNAKKREDIFKKFHSKGYFFPTVVHPSAVVAKDVVLGNGTVVMAGVIIQPGCQIEENVIINTGAQIDHDGHISSHVHISPGAILCGEVCVEDGAHIGAGAKIVQIVKIGKATIIAAGAVVIRDAPAHSMLKGMPAVVYKEI